MSQVEQEANDAIQKACQALSRARELAELAGYGSQVLVPLKDAQKEANYALDTAMCRN